MYPVIILIYFISAAVLLASLALIVQVSLPYNKTERNSVLYSYNFILVFLRVFCGINVSDHVK